MGTVSPLAAALNIRFDSLMKSMTGTETALGFFATMFNRGESQSVVKCNIQVPG